MDLLHEYTGNEAFRNASTSSGKKEGGKLISLIAPGDSLEIFSLLNAGDQQAFAKIYDELFPYVFFCARRMLENEDALDVAEIVFIKLWQLPQKQFINVAHLKAFLRTIIRNESVNLLRSQKSKRTREETFSKLSVEGEDEVDREDIHSALMCRVHEAIEKLPKRSRIIFKMAYIRQLKNKEIARRLGISEKTVKNQKVLALKNLKATFLSILFLFLYFSNWNNG